MDKGTESRLCCYPRMPDLSVSMRKQDFHLSKKNQDLKNQEKNQRLFHGKKTARHSTHRLKDGEMQAFTKNQKEKQKNSKLKDRQLHA